MPVSRTSSPSHPAAVPLRYETSFEHAEGNEVETNESLLKSLDKVQSKVYEDSGRAERGVHAKSHGILRGDLRVLDGLPREYAQGLFATSATYPLIMRLSTIPGDLLDDSISTPRGLAVKVLGVSGARLPGSESDTTQDFVLVNAPAFAKSTAKDFSSTLKQLAATTDKAQGAKKVLSAVMRGAEKVVEAVGGQSATLITLGGHPETNVLGETFYSQTPYLYGAYMAKIAVFPASEALRALTKSPVDLSGRPNGLRDAVVDFFASQGGEWDVRVQLCTDLETMPIEDASKQWPEESSPYVSVAHISATPQVAWSADRSAAVDDSVSFSPWHGLAAHRPLGSVNRARKVPYEHAAAFRARHNCVTIREPRDLGDWT